jgi:hypothetical protein
MLRSAGCSLLRAEDFSCSLDILYGSQGVSKLQVFFKKIGNNFVSAENFIKFLRSSKTWSQIRISINQKCRVRIRIATNTDHKCRNLKELVWRCFKKYFCKMKLNRARIQRIKWIPDPQPCLKSSGIQGGSDKSGTLSLLHRRIKK